MAHCPNCNNIFKISENLDIFIDYEFDFNNPPDGTWMRNDKNKTIIGATTRSRIAFFLVPFIIIWSGGSIGGIYGNQIANGEFDLSQSLFGIPFLIGSIIFWSLALMTIWGKVELTLDNKGGKIITGIGNIGLINRFHWNDITKIKQGKPNIYYPGSQRGTLVLEGKKRISFGLGVKQDRRYFILNAIKYTISKRRLIKNFV